MDRTQEKFTLRCLTYPGKNDGEPGFFAHCIDLDLLVWRPTLDRAKHELEEQIVGYFEGVSSYDEFLQLIKRPAPFWPYRVRYHTFALIRGIPRIWRNMGRDRNFFDRSISFDGFAHAT